MITTFVNEILTTLVGASFLTSYPWFSPMVIAILSSSFMLLCVKLITAPLLRLINYVMYGGKRHDK